MSTHVQQTVEIFDLQQISSKLEQEGLQPLLQAWKLICGSTHQCSEQVLPLTPLLWSRQRRSTELIPGLPEQPVVNQRRPSRRLVRRAIVDDHYPTLQLGSRCANTDFRWWVIAFASVATVSLRESAQKELIHQFGGAKHLHRYLEGAFPGGVQAAWNYLINYIKVVIHRIYDKQIQPRPDHTHVAEQKTYQTPKPHAARLQQVDQEIDQPPPSKVPAGLGIIRRMIMEIPGERTFNESLALIGAINLIDLASIGRLTPHMSNEVCKDIAHAPKEEQVQTYLVIDELERLIRLHLKRVASTNIRGITQLSNAVHALRKHHLGDEHVMPLAMTVQEKTVPR